MKREISHVVLLTALEAGAPSDHTAGLMSVASIKVSRVTV
jgi:hypothetical protein